MRETRPERAARRGPRATREQGLERADSDRGHVVFLLFEGETRRQKLVSKRVREEGAGGRGARGTSANANATEAAYSHVRVALTPIRATPRARARALMHRRTRRATQQQGRDASGGTHIVSLVGEETVTGLAREQLVRGGSSPDARCRRSTFSHAEARRGSGVEGGVERGGWQRLSCGLSRHVRAEGGEVDTRRELENGFCGKCEWETFGVKSKFPGSHQNFRGHIKTSGVTSKCR